MKAKEINLRNIFYVLAIATLSIYILISAKIVIAPIVFSAFFSLLLRPLATFFERKFKRRVLSILVTYFVAVIPLIAALFFFSTQLISLFKNLPSVETELRETIKSVSDWLNQKFQLNINETSDLVSENMMTILDTPLTFIKDSIESTTMVLVNIVLIILLTFFMLLYRTAFKNFIEVSI